jgi:ribosomal protein S18 acetylase RimI-like enzyme
VSRLIEICRRLPTVEEHAWLFERVGWPWYGEEATRRALAGSSFGVVAMRGDEIVGMGRMVGDGSVFFYMQDIVVDPDVQRLGIGGSLVSALLARARELSCHQPHTWPTLRDSPGEPGSANERFGRPP